MKASDWKIFEGGKVIPPKDFWVKLAAFYSRQSKPLSAELQELLERLGVVRSAAKK
jgi:hypothetical protein